MSNKLYDYIDSIINNGVGKDVWCMTKQTMTDFYMPFFIAEIVETYKTKHLVDETFGIYYSRCFRENPYTLAKFPKQSESENTYRNAIISEFFGLFYREKSGYDSGVVTPAYKVLKKYIKDHNDIKKYRFLIDRQIEKLCLNINPNTRIYDDVKGVTIFPVMLLYKTLIELQKKYGNSKLDYNEFLLFLVYSKNYNTWTDILELIEMYRTLDISEEYKHKISTILTDGSMTNIRFDTLFGTLEHIKYADNRSGNYYCIKEGERSIQYISSIVEMFEHSDYVDCTDKRKLMTFMQSDKYFIGDLDLFSIVYEEKEEEVMEEQDDILEIIKEKYENKDFEYVDVKPLYDDFKELYGKETLKSLNGKPLLYRLFALKKMDNNSMIYRLEHDTTYKYFGGIGGGSSFKFSLYYSDEKRSWVKGTHSSNLQLISEEDAIAFAESFRNNLVEIIEKIESYSESDLLSNVDNYIEIENFAKQKLGNLAEYGWILKYLHLTFPNLFSCMTNLVWFKKIFSVLGLDVNCSIYERNYRFSKLAKELGVPNVYLYKIAKEMLDYVDEETTDVEENLVPDEIDYDNIQRLNDGTNIILYGVPGAGKSYTIDNEYSDSKTKKERVVFHPDYTYSDFVGQILPKSQDGNVSYEFIPGPFTKIMKDARYNPNEKFILVIEEINRGNAPAIFGDIFQLLDRRSNHDKINGFDKYGESLYGIYNADIAKIVYGDPSHEVKIPSNLSIICTMNTSDQNVFTLDTAFQRRWNMRLIENSFNKETPEEKAFAEQTILDTTVSWEHFCITINDLILEKNQNMTSSEDKRLGTHFVNLEDLIYDSDELNEDATPEQRKEARLKNRRFPEKVIKYLWDDAFKFYRDEIFKGEFTSLEKVIKEFTTKTKDDRFGIFKDSIKADIIKKSN